MKYTDTQRREAADWFVLIRDAAPEDEVLQEWLRWMEGPPGNREAFEAIAQAWEFTPLAPAVAPSSRELAADQYDGEIPVAEWRARATPETSASRARFVPALAAALVLAVVGGWFAFDRFGNPFAPSSGQFATRTGEHMELTLADGSQVWLGAKSRLTVDYTQARRNLRLESGEAYFEVRKDSSRPFTVHTRNGAITAIGTAFNVRMIDDRVTVAVTEGIVRVAEEEAPAAPPSNASTSPSPSRAVTALQVNSGQRLTLGADEKGWHAPVALAVTDDPESRERARWRDGWLVYRDEPLRYVIADVARYTDRRLEITDGPAAELRFSGAVYKSSIDEWISALPESFPITVDANAEGFSIKTK